MRPRPPAGQMTAAAHASQVLHMVSEGTGLPCYGEVAVLPGVLGQKLLHGKSLTQALLNDTFAFGSSLTSEGVCGRQTPGAAAELGKAFREDYRPFKSSATDAARRHGCVISGSEGACDSSRLGAALTHVSLGACTLSARRGHTTPGSHACRAGAEGSLGHAAAAVPQAGRERHLPSGHLLL